MTWIQKETVLIHEVNDTSNKLAMFDFDGTLVRSKSGKKMISSVDDIKLNYDNIPNILNKLKKNNYQIIIFSNQKGISTKKTSEKEIKERFNKFFKLVNMKVLTYIATSNDYYRKPHTNMFILFKNKFKKEIDLGKSFYIGDAGGRYKDFAISDRAFAYNLNVIFATPEEIFKDDQSIHWNWKFPDPHTFIKTIKFKPNLENKEMILLVGPPSSGKSTFAKTVYKSYKYISQDELGTITKTIKYTKNEINNGNNIIIDNTNPTLDKRKLFIDLAKDYKIICYFFDYKYELVRHLNNYREEVCGRHIPDVALRVYYKKLVKPTLNEGITNITRFEFLPNFEERKEYFFRYD